MHWPNLFWQPSPLLLSLCLILTESSLKLQHSDHQPTQDTGSTFMQLYKGTLEHTGKWLPARKLCTSAGGERRKGEIRWRRWEREKGGGGKKRRTMLCFFPQSPTRSRLRPLFLLKKSFVESLQSRKSKPLSENKEKCVLRSSLPLWLCVRVNPSVCASKSKIVLVWEIASLSVREVCNRCKSCVWVWIRQSVCDCLLHFLCAEDWVVEKKDLCPSLKFSNDVTCAHAYGPHVNHT